ncbi:uncharacterized protein LOC131933145 [Physella acuta]|uniref:uncharacterized protein LOC131933145 n=1 Tax=Physella acuta TaxID=109671 RepID=UPI0027DE89A5|nr:uncharacterized protein LOC131933145 [Physella acuta]
MASRELHLLITALILVVGECKEDEQYQLRANDLKKSVFEKRKNPCKPDEFKCDIETCLPRDSTCDGHVDCKDSSDETFCIPCSQSNSFLCTNNKCIPTYSRCDGANDCGDGSDEEKCNVSIVSLENESANLTFTIPNTKQANGSVLITIGNGVPPAGSNFVFLYPMTWSFKFKTNHTVRVDQAKRKVEIQIKNVTAKDAGHYKCYVGASDIVVDDCGLTFVVLRKPNPPEVIVLSRPLVGDTLKLSCKPHSTSLPPDHGLPSRIWWLDQMGVSLVPGSNQRGNSPRSFLVNARNELELSSISSTDKGLKFSCKSADGKPDYPKEKLLMSAASTTYVLVPEFKPLVANMTITPPATPNGQISKNIGDQISYTCDIQCSPPCEVKWLFKPNDKINFTQVVSQVDTKILKVVVNSSSIGVYRCLGSNPHGSVLKDFNLNVQVRWVADLPEVVTRRPGANGQSKEIIA